MRKTLLILLFALLFTFSCTDTKNSVDKDVVELHYIGIVIDANVVPTSWNESIKVEIKTNINFIVVYGIPQLNIGDTLYGQYNGMTIYKILDATNKLYVVAHY